MSASPNTKRFALLPGASSLGRAAVVVLHGAALPELEATLRFVSAVGSELTLVAVDGGLGTCAEAGQTPELFVGDGDSWTGELPDCETVRYRRDKDHSDLSGALDRLTSRVDWIAVVGLTGGRLDHEWGNLLEIGRNAKRFSAIVAQGERGMVIVTAGGCRVGLRAEETFSLFALNGQAAVTLSGARWELSRQRLEPGSRGLSNVATGPLELTVHEGVALLVVPPGGPDL